jgi:hypothetical protein
LSTGMFSANEVVSMLAILDSTIFIFALGIIFLVFAYLRLARGPSKPFKNIGFLVFLICGSVMLFEGFYSIH